MSRALLSAGLLSLLPVSIAAAQTPCGLRTHFRIVTNMSEANNPGELRLDSGWVTARPDTLPGLITTTNPYGMESSGSCTAIADYGDLRCNGSGQAHAVSGIGAFLWLDEWLCGAPKAQYSDQVTITSATLPAGTPVDIQFTLTLAGSAEVIDTNPSVHYSALLTVNDPGSPGLRLTQGQAPGTVTGVLTTAVGHTMVPAAALNVSLQAYGILGGGTNSSYSCSLRATTTMNILTPGVTATSCSGHTYSGCGSADFNGDGDIGTDADIESFFACLAGNCCPTCFGGGADFNGDGDTGTDAVIESFFRVLAGGASDRSGICGRDAHTRRQDPRRSPSQRHGLRPDNSWLHRRGARMGP